MHQALYRKWRPRTFDEVCGQDHITSVLKYEIENNKVSHAYLFCGSRGTGKTSCAKILAKAINCESPVNGSPCNKCAACMSIDAGIATDVLEMDAASNNGVDNIRDIRDEVVYLPTALKYRVYIVDEVHMLSGSAFNALLKTLEEPPSHVIFILATTELHKLPSTIVSRCQRFDFRRISTEVLTERLAYISENEDIEYESEALRLIAKFAQGGMRDAISLLELSAGAKKKITVGVVDETIGSGGRDNIENTIKAISDKSFDAIFSAIDSVVRSSRDVKVFCQELLGYYRDMLVFKTTSTADRYLDLTENETERLSDVSSRFTKETLLYHCRILDDAIASMDRAGASKRTIAEMALIKMCDTSLDTSVEALLSRISALENAIASGNVVQTVAKAEEKSQIKENDTSNNEKIEKATIDVIETEKKTEKVLLEDSLKPMRGWNEIAERAASGDPSVKAFLKLARTFVSPDGRIYIKFPNEFAKGTVDNPKVRDGIRAAIGIVTGRQIEDKDLNLGVIKGDEKISDLDEFDE